MFRGSSFWMCMRMHNFFTVQSMLVVRLGRRGLLGILYGCCLEEDEV